jgi:hypothetical protein
MKTYGLQPPADTLRSLLWQHGNAQALQAIARAKEAWLAQHHEAFWQSWSRDVFSLDTANDFGLSVWALILGYSAITAAPQGETGPVFGFHPETDENFDNGGFSAVSGNRVTVTAEQKRMLLKMRWFQMTTRCTVPEINRFLASLFKNYGKAYVLDGLDMGYATYVFCFTPPPEVMDLIEHYDILPRPAAVGVRAVVSTREDFGFEEPNDNFDNGTFADKGPY